MAAPSSDGSVPEPSGSPTLASPAASPPPVSDGYRRYVLGLLLVVYIFNFIDRQILSILAEPIAEDLGLSDTQLGLLTGLAFAAFYTFAGIPIARWADRGTRRTIVALGLFAWSAMTMVTGFTRSFAQILLARIGVGLGEAACSPPAHSMLSDYFPPERRGTAFSIYALGIPIGTALGYFTGGWIQELFDWRTAFLFVGAPGLLLALVVRLTLREPERGMSDPPAAGAGPGSDRPMPSLGDVLRFMGPLRSFRHMSMAAALHAFYGYGAGAFLPIFLVRVHDLGYGELGTYLGLVAILGGGVGTFLGGWIGDHLAPRDQRWYMWVPGISTAIAIPFAVGLYLWPDAYIALVLAVPTGLLGAMWLGPTFAMAQGLSTARSRALVSAVLLFIINLIGLGLGPLAVGMLSDHLAPTYGDESVRYALLWVVVGGAAWSTLHYAFAARSLRADLEAKHTANV